MANALCIKKEIHEQEESPWVEAEIVLTLGELIDFDIEVLNDYAQDAIMEPSEGMLMNIGYEVVSCDPSNNTVNVKVSADIDVW